LIKLINGYLTLISYVLLLFNALNLSALLTLPFLYYVKLFGNADPDYTSYSPFYIEVVTLVLNGNLRLKGAVLFSDDSMA